MKIKFCGAAQVVTGSAHLITLNDGFTILLDCGLYQGNNEDMDHFNETWLFDPKELDCLVLSHAHIDHCGRIPKLVRDGFKGKIYSTHATRDISAIMMLDSAGIQESDVKFYNKRIEKKHKSPKLIKEPLYTIEDAQNSLRFFIGYNYENWFYVHPDVKVMFRDVGHILGSGSVYLEVNENGITKRIGFTGDIGRPNRPILDDPKQLPQCDYLICESTYGDRDHIQAPAELDQFVNIINETCVEKKGKVIIPAFSLGRTQEILYLLDQLYNSGRLPKVPVFLDSPLAINATEIFRLHPECFDKELHEYMMKDPNPFGFNTLQYVKTVEMSKGLNVANNPCIIISASGMANAGRVKHHLFNNIEDPRNTVLIVGYCTPQTPGGVIRSGATEVKLFGEMKQIRARVEIMDSFSAHGDRHEMLDFIKNQVPELKQLFLVHGEKEVQDHFKVFLTEAGFNNISIPHLSEIVEI